MDRKLSTLLGGTEHPHSSSPVRRHPADWRTRAARLLPVVLVGMFLVLLALVLGDRLVPARELPITSVVTLRSEPGEAAGSGIPGADPWDAPLLFQASGWIEPDPLPIKATALVDGVVDSVEILEGESVEAGQLLATLIDADAILDLQTAESRLASLEAQAAAHHRLAEVTEAEMATLEKQVAAAQAKRDERADEAQRFASMPKGSVPERDVSQARLQLATQEAEIAALAASGAELESTLDRLSQVAKDIDARIAEAATEVARRQLALDRTRIKSPVDGVVLRLLAVPGEKRMLAMDDHDSATIAILYQPDRLQTRIDVPLEEAAQLAVGQPVRIRSNFLPDRTFRGTVTRIVGAADLQRNTLQAKVRIEDPDPRLRPEMLCRAEFLAPSTTTGSTTTGTAGSTATQSGAGRVKVFVPESALVDPSGGDAHVWALDGSGDRLVRLPITLGSERHGDHRLVVDGLRPGDRVVVDPPADLEPGQRARPRD
ncbi:HlyD family efflux transporter periplasmic adaptor subunit [soil metagenome]